MARLEGTLVLPDGYAVGAVHYREPDDTDEVATITEVEVGARLEAPAEAPYLLAGFVDAHVHGGGGADTMDGAEGVVTMARFHLRQGTTTLLPTTITNPWERVLAALDGVREVMRGRARPEGPFPSIPGAHLEGPFVSARRLGAQPPFAVEPDPDRVAAVLAKGVVRVVTMAPELRHAPAAAEAFARAGVRVSVGHTVASAEEVMVVAERVRAAGGTVGYTHLFNAMTQLVGRDPGAVGAALADGEAFAELILDLHHVHPTAFRAALAAKPGRLHLVTDAIRACGAGDGESELGGATVRVEGGAVRLPDGTLAGSVLTLDRAVRNAVSLGVPLRVASRLASAVPAAYLGLADRGELAVGKRADVVVLDEALEVQDVVVGGRRVALRA